MRRRPSIAHPSQPMRAGTGGLSCVEAFIIARRYK
jgi:hypothetical protein